jgi:hypothetical protein
LVAGLAWRLLRKGYWDAGALGEGKEEQKGIEPPAC